MRTGRRPRRQIYKGRAAAEGEDTQKPQSIPMNKAYLFSDESASYRRPHQPKRGDSVIVRFQTAEADREHVKVYLVHDSRRLPMRFVETVGALAMFQLWIPMVTRTYSYYFEVEEELQEEAGDGEIIIDG